MSILFDQTFSPQDQIFFVSNGKLAFENKPAKKEALFSRVKRWNQRKGNKSYCLDEVIKVIAKDATDSKNINRVKSFDTLINRLEFFDKKAEKHNKRLFVRIVSIFTKKFRCKRLENEIKDLQEIKGKLDNLNNQELDALNFIFKK